MALVVDGNTFVQTGWRFLVLPNSQQQVALPFWELQSQPTPVSLTSIECDAPDDYGLGVEMSDGSIKAVVLPDTNNLVYNCAIDSMVISFGVDCQDSVGAGECTQANSNAMTSEHDPVVGNISYYSCSMPATKLNCRVAIEIAGVTFVSNEINVSPEDMDSIAFADFEIIES